MTLPKVSVIMPAYNHGRYIGEAIQSVLNQTYADWELMIVNDGSTDSTADAVARFDDRRIHYIFQTNKGVSEARNVAIGASSGEYLAFLDADDLFHPWNLETQVAHLDRNPEIGLTYVSRTEIDQDGNPLRFHRPPLKTTLKELILGFPFCPSDFMIRRSWIERVGSFNRCYVINEDRDFFLRLALAGCQFAGTDRFLACHRFYGGRTFPDLPAKLNDMLRVLDTVFTDPNCPAEILSLHSLAHRNIYIEWAYQASVKNETALAKEYFREALRYDRSMEANPDELFQRLVEAATRDGGEHEERLRMTFEHLPAEAKQSPEHLHWAVAYGYLHQGLRDLMWERVEKAKENLNKAVMHGVRLDLRSLRMLRYQLLSYDAGFDTKRMHDALRKVSPFLEKIGGQKGARRFLGWYSFTRALRYYHDGEFASAVKEVGRALSNNPEYLRNRELLSVLFRSIRALLLK